MISDCHRRTSIKKSDVWVAGDYTWQLPATFFCPYGNAVANVPIFCGCMVGESVHKALVVD